MVPPRSVKLEILRSVRFDQKDAKRPEVIKGSEPAISPGLTCYLQCGVLFSHICTHHTPDIRLADAVW